MGILGALGVTLGILDRLIAVADANKARTVNGEVVNRRLGAGDVQQQPKRKATLHNVRTIDDRIKYIKKLIKIGGTSAQVRALAHKHLNRKCGDEWCVPEKDQLAEVQELFAQIRKRVRYVLDPVRVDTYTTPESTIFELNGGDCDDSTAALGALLESVGYPVKLRVVQTQGNPTWNHIYLIAQLTYSKKWIALDPSQDKPAGWEVPASVVIAKRDFEV